MIAHASDPNAKPVAGSLWQYDYGSMPEGTYTFVTDWNQRHPVNDGYHVCTDLLTGEPAALPPSLYPAESGTWTVTIYVGDDCPF